MMVTSAQFIFTICQHKFNPFTTWYLACKLSFSIIPVSPVAGAIAGANIVADGSASIRGVLEAYGQAAAVMLNAEGGGAAGATVTVPSVASNKGAQTTLFAGSFSDDFVHKVHAKGSLHGAYYNTLSAGGVSAVFGGFIGPAGPAAPVAAPGFVAQSSPVVECGGVTAVTLSPDNVVSAPSTVVFVDASSSASSLSLDQAVVRLTGGEGEGEDGGADEVAAAAAKKVLGGAKVIVVKSEKEAEQYIL